MVLRITGLDTDADRDILKVAAVPREFLLSGLESPGLLPRPGLSFSSRESWDRPQPPIPATAKARAL